MNLFSLLTLDGNRQITNGANSTLLNNRSLPLPILYFNGHRGASENLSGGFRSLNRLITIKRDPRLANSAQWCLK
jgi:hypothetical protein